MTGKEKEKEKRKEGEEIRHDIKKIEVKFLSNVHIGDNYYQKGKTYSIPLDIYDIVKKYCAPIEKNKIIKPE